MGLLQTTQKAGLLNKSNPTPSLQGVDFNVTTPQTSFDVNTPVTPRFAQPTVPSTPKTGALTGATTLSQGTLSPVEKIKSSIPSGFSGDILRGVIDAPKTIGKEAGLFDEENVVKLDRLAQSLIQKGADPTRAYDIASVDLQRGKNVQSVEDFKKLSVTPEEEDALRTARLTNAFMTGLTVSNLAPGAGAMTKNVGELLLKIAGSKEENVIAKHLLDIGIPKEKVPTLATTLTGVSKPEVVNKIIQDAVTVPKAGLLNRSLSEQMLGAKDTINAEELSSTVKNSLLNEPKGKFDKPERFTGEGYSYKEAETGLAEDGTYHKNRIVIGYNDKGEQILVDGTHLLEAYRDLGIPIPKDKVEFLPKPKQVVNKTTVRTPEELALAKEKLQKKLEPTSVSPRKVQPVETVPERGATTASQAEDLLSKVPNQYKREVLSFDDIIERTQTNVKDKVNVLDYLRTPDRVLEKIGFANEAKAVRKGYEAYIKELPKNIDKITEWSKRVPKESNERIFKYLDGQKIALDSTETKVASEVKEWLKEWATRLKLPEDNQISHYITHIFDRELIGKEFDEDLAKLITDRLPGQVYDPFLEKRLGALGYKQDTWQALDAYVKRATRKVNMDDALEMIRDKAGTSLELSKIEASQFKYLQRYVNNVNMRPTELDNLIDNTLKSIFGYKYGNRPVTVLTKLLRQLTFKGMLGLNPGSALRNLSQGINTYAKLGEKHTIIGYSKLLSPHGRQEIIDSGILADNFIQDRALSATKKTLEKIDTGLFAMFDLAEKINRGAAFLGGKSKALAEGMSEEKAVEYAKKIVRDTQFNFGSIDTPVALQNDIAKTLTQFQTYTVKQIEFLTEMAKNKEFIGILRYALSGLVFVYTIGKAFNMTPEQLIPSLRFDTPPSLKLPTELVKAGLNTPDKYGQPRSLEQKISDIGKSSIGLIPGGTQAKKTIEGEELIRKGGSFDKGGNLQYEGPQTTAGKAQALLFGKYSGEKAQKYFDRSAQSKKDMEDIKPFYDQIQQLKKEGKTQEALEIYDSLGDKGKEVYQKIKSQSKTQETKKGKEEMLPTFQKIRALKDTNPGEAVRMYNALSDDEKKYYQLLKKQLEK